MSAIMAINLARLEGKIGSNPELIGYYPHFLLEYYTEKQLIESRP